MSNYELEHGRQQHLDFEKLHSVLATGESVIPAVVQEAESKAVLILGYVNRQALAHALKHKLVTFWSSSRNSLWVKGESSGNRLHLVEVRINCEQNSILYLARLEGQGACHVCDEQGIPHPSCYYRRLTSAGELEFL